MKLTVILRVLCFLVVVAVAGNGLAPEPIEADSVQAIDPREISTAFNDTPEHREIVRKLKEAGAFQILRTAYSVATSKNGDFANVRIEYYLDEAWVFGPKLRLRRKASYRAAWQRS